MSVLGEALSALASVFDTRGIAWYVFGAQAVAIRGAPRATQDLDITVDIPRDELPGVVAELAQVGLDVRYPDRFEELLAVGAVVPLIHSSGFEVDMVVAGSGLEQLAFSRARRLTIEGASVPVAHTTDLVVMKLLAGRGKDLEDVRALLAGGDADLDEVRDLLEQLQQALGQSDLLPALEAALRDIQPE